MKLLIDIGNQRLKWATSDQLQCTKDEAFHQRIERQAIDIIDSSLANPVAHFNNLAEPESIWISSVAGASINREIEKFCQNIWYKRPSFISSSFKYCGLENGYENPRTLGVDRWMAIIGAQYYVKTHPTIVIDVGTAVTLDYIDRHGKFSGGVILPGIATMINSLNNKTGNIKALFEAGKIDRIHYQNDTTQKAVENGVVLAAVAAVDRAVTHYSMIEDANIETLITGGDANIIAKLSRHKLKSIPELVLVGLLMVAEEAGR